ncbi:MAG TPA: group 1 truncated hemoglobin [Tepidiformaceae bacterium]|nr:group 1 truncated hemoglobin [Tepidiformaceae bacterium]HSE46562.1 group 1 truncated hemoglobin [Gemmatimonadales bacterium]
MTQLEDRASTATLYERLGGHDRLYAIISDIVDAHLQNASIHTRFEPFDRQVMKDNAFLFFAQATGGPEAYEGRGLLETHRGMNVNEQEFVSATDDVLAVLRAHGVPEREQQEVLAAFFAMKDEVLHK